MAHDARLVPPVAGAHGAGEPATREARAEAAAPVVHRHGVVQGMSAAPHGEAGADVGARLVALRAADGRLAARHRDAEAAVLERAVALDVEALTSQGEAVAAVVHGLARRDRIACTGDAEPVADVAAGQDVGGTREPAVWREHAGREALYYPGTLDGQGGATAENVNPDAPATALDRLTAERQHGCGTARRHVDQEAPARTGMAGDGVGLRERARAYQHVPAVTRDVRPPAVDVVTAAAGTGGARGDAERKREGQRRDRQPEGSHSATRA